MMRQSLYNPVLLCITYREQLAGREPQHGNFTTYVIISTYERDMRPTEKQLLLQNLCNSFYFR